MLSSTGGGAQVADKSAARSGPGSTVLVTGLPSEGLDLISPEAPVFDTAVRELAPKGEVSFILGLKPLLAILSNRSGHSVVAYATIWKVGYRDGTTKTTNTSVLLVDAVSGAVGAGVEFSDNENSPILSGERRLVAKDTEFGAPSQKYTAQEKRDLTNWLRATIEDQKTELGDAREVQLSLDAAIFSDGFIVGPDNSGLDRIFMSKFEAKQSLLQQIVSDLDGGRTFEEAFGPAKALATRELGPSRDPSVIYETLAAQEIVALRKRIGDSAVAATFRQAIRKEPFVIRKPSTESGVESRNP